jgi:tRNA threonylcarbamoyladenosine biosynthesis protein TsaE
VWRLPTAADTVRLGAALAGSCLPGDRPRLLFLSGELGAGKTTLAAAVLDAMGVTEAVRSPSYALVETYSLEQGIAVHVDCYRLNDPRELEQLGLRDYFAPRALWLVEWPERAGAELPQPDLWLRLQVLDSGRAAEIESNGAAGASWLQRLQQLLPCQSRN